MKEKTWIKIVITAEPEITDSLTDFLVGMFDAGVESGAKDEAHYGIVTAWLENIDNTIMREHVLHQIQQYIDTLESTFHISGTKIEWEEIQDQDWGAEWKKFFTPFSIIPNLSIVPKWEEYQPEPDEQIIIMDPGLAFGTGHHDTTRFSLELLQNAVYAGGRTLLDVGTGTAILAMGGVLFGIDKATAIDNDPDAVAAAEENICYNNLQEQISVSINPLTTIDGVFDIVIANIIHDVLISMAETLVARTAIGGNLILSGILIGEQSQSIVQCFTNFGMEVIEERTGEEWAAFRFLKK